MHETTPKPEKAIVVSIVKKGSDRKRAAEYQNELKSLAENAGAEIVEHFYQELDRPIPATAIGKGKVEEIRLVIEEKGIQIVIFDDDLTPAQVKNLVREFKVKVTDRSGIILDIFAKRARSPESKTQVELAQLQYMLPRLTRMWTHFSESFGGIGTRGPGETQIETDRRMLRIRVQKLKEKLLEIDVQREQQRKGRSSLPRIALVGYTNAGKSTLMNALTQSGAYVENKLFATLDTTVRAFELPGGQKALLSDTVGFIRKLPTHLVASFRSTLAEAAEADILLHVIDVTHEFFLEQIHVVNDTLEYLKIHEKPVIMVFNKIDMLEGYDGLRNLDQEYPNSIFISAERNMNIIGLLSLIQKVLDETSKTIEFVLPYSSMELVSKLYDIADIRKREENDDGIYFQVRVQPDKSDYFYHYFGELLAAHKEG